jgi:predicted transcriptional regulator
MSELEDLKKRNAELEKYFKNSESAKNKTESFSKEYGKASERISGSLGEWTLDIKKFSDSIEVAAGNLGEALSPFDLKAFQELDEKATVIQKTFGTTKGRLEEFKQTIADTIPELIKMGIEEQKALGNIQELMTSMGTAASLGVEAITEISAASEISGIGAGKLASSFRDVGISIYDVGDEMKEVTEYARSVGVSVSAVSAKVTENIGKMNLYNFDGGVKGLAKMAATSERLGISMDKVFEIADNLMSPEKAIDMSAALQRLGVTSSGLLDPLRAMDMAQNDPESLQKEMVELSKTFTKFNEETGKTEILPGSKRRLREVAEAFGYTGAKGAEEFAALGIKATQFDEKMKQIQFPSLATDQETKEMIAGMAQLKDGKAVINVKNEQTGTLELKQVDQLTASDIESLKETQEDGSKTIEEIALNQLSVSEQIAKNTEGFTKTIAYGKATSEPLEKMVTSVMGLQQEVSKGLAKSVTTGGVRKGYNAFGQPAEDYITAGMSGDKSKQMIAEKDFVQAFIDTEKSIREGAQEFVNSTAKNFTATLKETYSQPQKVETTATVNLNMSLTGDANVKNMDLNSVQDKIVNYLTQTAEGKSLLQEAVQNKNVPMSAQGAKNK